MITRHVYANPRYAVAHPGIAVPDLETDGADAALAFTADDTTLIGLFTHQGLANVGEIILRFLVQAQQEEIVTKVLQQVTLEMHPSSKPTVVVPRNTIQQAILLPPEGER